jgi:hypothetical protein
MWFAAGAVCATLGAGLLLRSKYEKEQLSVERTTIESTKIGKNYKAVFLSDLHDHQFGDKNKRLLAAVSEVNPDILLIGGDMMVSKGGADVKISLELVEQLVKRYPVYYGNGNHECRMYWKPSVYGDLYSEYVHSLKKLGVRLLDNRTELYEDDLAISGIDLDSGIYESFHADQLRTEKIHEKVGKASKERFQILLCHSPLCFSACREWGADLTLSGHFHGGTIRIPYLGGVMTPQYQFFNPYCAGEFLEDGKWMIVSRGLGTHSINIRLNNKPQLVVIDLKAKTG